MPLFSSDREQRLWAWALAVVVAIYSTLGVAPSLAGFLRDTGLIEGAAFLSLALIVSTILMQGLKVRPGGAEIGVAAGVVAVYVMLFLRMATPWEERTHLMEYGVVAVLIYEALSERVSQGRHVPIPALIAALAASFLGILDECIQLILPSRVFDPIDILFNVLAATMAVLAMVLLGWARARTIRARSTGDG